MGCKLRSLSILSLAPPTILDGAVALTPPSQQAPAAAAPPFCSVGPASMGPGPGALNHYGAEVNPVYGGSAVLPAGLPPQGPELQPHEGTQHEAGWPGRGMGGEESILQTPFSREPVSYCPFYRISSERHTLSLG